MAHKKTTSKQVARTASKILRDPKASKKAKSAAGSALSQSPGRHRKSKDVAAPKSASQIRKEVGVTKRDRMIARKAARR